MTRSACVMKKVLYLENRHYSEKWSKGFTIGHMRHDEILLCHKFITAQWFTEKKIKITGSSISMNWQARLVCWPIFSCVWVCICVCSAKRSHSLCKIIVYRLLKNCYVIKHVLKCVSKWLQTVLTDMCHNSPGAPLVDCFQTCAAINLNIKCVAMNMRMWVYLAHINFIFFGYISKSEIAEWYDSYDFNFLNCLHIAFQNNQIILLLIIQAMYRQFPFLPILSYPYLSSFCQNLLTCVRWYNIVVLLYIFLMTSDTEHFLCLQIVYWPFMCFLLRNISSSPVTL